MQWGAEGVMRQVQRPPLLHRRATASSSFTNEIIIDIMFLLFYLCTVLSYIPPDLVIIIVSHSMHFNLTKFPPHFFL